MAKTTKQIKYYEAIGRRKEAVARVRLYITGKDKSALIDEKKMMLGEIVINEKKLEEYFPSLAEKRQFLKPLEVANCVDRFVISIKLVGGGKQSQLDAVKLGLSRALELTDKEGLHTLLKKEGMLTRDSRARERRKVGTGGKARRAKQSPKR